MQTYLEPAFSLVYLTAVITLGLIMLIKGQSKTVRLFGATAVILGGGDAFHLIPRAISEIFNNHSHLMMGFVGYGKLVTSVTMTIFYVLMFFILKQLFNQRWAALTIIVIVLAVVRIGLCLFPQNAWASMTPPVSWGIYRNIPFTLLGIIVIAAYFSQPSSPLYKQYIGIPVAVILSFLFYIPVVIFALSFPPIGILMIPKTLAYSWLVLIGFLMYRQEKQNPVN